MEERHYIAGVAVVTVKEGNLSIPAESYTLKDTLGSVVGYVDIGQLLAGKADAVERTFFDPWGKRRKDQNLADLSMTEMLSYQSAISDRGFTGHEHIDAIGLIHMNGRVYDPLIGRFISADPIIQDPSDLQSLNRYTYVRNNPVTLTDPSGFSWVSKTWKKLRRAVEKTAGFNFIAVIWKKSAREFGRFARKNKYVSQAAQIVGCGAAVFASGSSSLAAAGGCSAATTSIIYGTTDGDFKAASKAGATAFVQTWGLVEIGALHSGGRLNLVQASLAHGGIGGMAAMAHGQSIISGFTSGVGSKMGGGVLHIDGVSGPAKAYNVIMSAAIGGTSSRLSGGSFANGAVTGAFIYLFNDQFPHILEQSRSTCSVVQCTLLTTTDGRKMWVPTSVAVKAKSADMFDRTLAAEQTVPSGTAFLELIGSGTSALQLAFPALTPVVSPIGLAADLALVYSTGDVRHFIPGVGGYAAARTVRGFGYEVSSPIVRRTGAAGDIMADQAMGSVRDE